VVIDREALYSHLPCDEWLAGSSRERMETERGEAWAREVFGMPAYERLRIGECIGMATEDAAIEHLGQTLTWDSRVGDYIRSLTILKVPEMPRCGEPFSLLVRAAQDWSLEHRVGSLLRLLAACWQLAAAIPPKKRGDAILPVVAIVRLLGLSQDAMALREKYL
jgi:hypothetical protein